MGVGWNPALSQVVGPSWNQMRQLHHVSDHDLNRYHLARINARELALIEEPSWGAHTALTGRKKTSAAFGKKTALTSAMY